MARRATASTTTSSASARSLQRELGKRTPFASRSQEAYLAIQRTASVLAGDFARLLREHGLSEATYNVLRILRGVQGAPGGGGTLTCSEVGERMVSPVPDVTRLVDRLQRRGLVKRSQGTEDRRVVRVAITRRGLDALATLDRPIMETHEKQLAHVAPADLARLIVLLARVRQGKGPIGKDPRGRA